MQKIDLQCIDCKGDILTQNINIQQMIAKCHTCGTVFNFGSNLHHQAHVHNVSSPDNWSKEEIVMPDGVEMLKLRSVLDINIKWKNKLHWFIVMFTLIWNGFLLFFAIVALISGSGLNVLLYMSLHIAVGLGLAYYCLCCLFNQTKISVNSRSIKVTYGPLPVPFYKNKAIDTIDIEQLFVERYVSSSSNKQPNYAFRLIVITKSHELIKLMQGLKTPTQALFTEQEIEKYIKIQDRPVEGEFQGY